MLHHLLDACNILAGPVRVQFHSRSARAILGPMGVVNGINGRSLGGSILPEPPTHVAKRLHLLRVSNTRVPTELGEIILQRMVDLGYHRQSDLARASGLGPDVISRAIFRDARPTLETLRALAGALGLNAETLIAFVHGDGGTLAVQPTVPVLDPDVAETNRLLHQDSHLTDDERDELRAFVKRLNASYRQRRRRDRSA